MRYCPNCKRINEGWPIRCRYCACTWSVRICRSGHENPLGVLFCGECGSADLSTAAPGGRLINWLFRLPQHAGLFGKIILLALPVLLLIVVIRNLNALMPLLFAVTVMILLAKFALNSVPAGIKSFLGRYYRNVTRGKKHRAGKAR